MRPTQKQNRSRGRGGRKPGGNNVNRVYESAGPEGKVRGTPQQIIDKYLTLARDAQTSGDRVVAENFLQHAEHYQRILLEAVGARTDRREHASEQDQPDLDLPDDDGETEDQAAEVAGEPRQGDDGEGRRRRRRQPGDDATRPGPSPYEPKHGEVSSLTTIDARGDDSESLLVDAEDLSDSQPRTRRRGPQSSEPEPVTAEADAPTE
jgi:hypothetical protein